MQIKRFIGIAISAFIFAFVGVGVANATTTIGSNISTDGTLAVTGATTLSSTLAVTDATTLSSTLAVTGATTMSAALTLTSTTNPQVTVKYDSSNYFSTYVDSTGETTFDITGSTVLHAFTFSDSVNIASTTNQTLLTVEGNTSSTTLAVYQAGGGDIINVFDSATEVFTILDGGNVGIASSTPTAMFAVGNEAGDHSATTTIDLGMPCFRMTVDDGGSISDIYMWPSFEEGILGGWATSTTSCF